MSLTQLKSALEQHVDFQINSIAACRRLEQLLIKQGHYVSYTTLSRIFSLAKINTHARSSTLDELTRYLGYNDYDSFLEVNDEREESNRKKMEALLEVESLFLANNERAAIRRLMKIKSETPKVFAYTSQFVGNYLFGSQKEHSQALEELLQYEHYTLDFLQLFVFEDDPYGHYANLLNQLAKRQSNNLELLQFSELFKQRKELMLSTKKMNPLFHKQDLTHFHLKSRSLELELLANIHSNKSILIETDTILQLIIDWKEADFALAYVGRWCRGLIYTNRYEVLKYHLAWKEQCISLLQIQEVNKEFQAPIYTFLALTHGYHGSLAFMYKGDWENAKLESKLLLSLAFQQHDAFKIYKRLLGYV
jgi:hypothetical protein